MGLSRFSEMMPLCSCHLRMPRPPTHMSPSFTAIHSPFSPFKRLPSPSPRITQGTTPASLILYTTPVLSSTVHMAPLNQTSSESSIPLPPAARLDFRSPSFELSQVTSAIVGDLFFPSNALEKKTAIS